MAYKYNVLYEYAYRTEQNRTEQDPIQARFARCSFFERWSIFNVAKKEKTSLNFFYVVLGKNIKNNETVFRTLLKNRDIFKIHEQCLKHYKTCDKFSSLFQTSASDYRLNKLNSTAEKHKKDYYDGIESLQKTYGYSDLDKTNLKADIESSAKKISDSFRLIYSV